MLRVLEMLRVRVEQVSEVVEVAGSLNSDAFSKVRRSFDDCVALAVEAMHLFS